jgi:hypothetical protein
MFWESFLLFAQHVSDITASKTDREKVMRQNTNKDRTE